MSPVLSEILRSGFMINSFLRRSTHLVQSLSVVFLYWFYVFSKLTWDNIKYHENKRKQKSSLIH
ncbi:hypothetical protein CDL12_05614 [Handroanthus impetiginosus]|uniref:Uncharacterized protein n=1 Tax=Handroanthus impetiginosus TaxID=429701 RepID=A0A2G9HVZ8_9LAMI|nr:hypothetical protein CDL12_05614 [Handroanthus impetiginosus]